MQISRLFEIVYILLNRRHTTARELAERFEVSVRTIYRDIDALAQAGVPVYAAQGAGGGIFISEQYVLNKSALTDAEQSQILLALRSLSITGEEDSDRLLSRLGSLFDKDSDHWIEVDFSRWEVGGRDRRAMALIKDAIVHRHPLTFTYYSGEGARSVRTVEPVKLLYKSRAWYMQAFCRERQAFRTFKLVRMTDLRLLDEQFERREPPAPPPESDEPFVPPPDMLPIILRFEPRIAWRVLDEFSPEAIRWEADGSLTVRVYFAFDDWLDGYILSFGTAAEVVSPPILRERVKANIQKLLSRYEDT